MARKPDRIVEPIDASFDAVADALMKKAPALLRDNAPPASEDTLSEGEAHLVDFDGVSIRQMFHEGEWLFSVVDVVGALSGTDRPSKYWSDLRTKLIEKEGFSELSDKIGKLKMPSHDGKDRDTDVCNVETLFRLVQSIPSKRAEPFRRWLAKVGYERIQEKHDPEISIKRAMAEWRAKGRPEEWVRARVQATLSRKQLTSEWSKRGVREGVEYAVLTDTISKGTFGIKTQSHKAVKGLKKHHVLRDHMTPLELALTMLGEATTAELARNIDAQGFEQNKTAATEGGKVAGGARKHIEKKIGRPVVTPENFLPQSKKTPGLPKK